MMDNVFDMFDMRMACVYTGNIGRVPMLESELGRVGLGVDKMWSFPTPFDGVLQSRFPVSAGMRKRGYFNSGMNHYRCVKTAYELGAGSLLIVEDDIRFLNDVGKAKEIFASTPEDYDFVLYDWFLPGRMTRDRGMAERELAAMAGRFQDPTEGWMRFDSMRSIACWALSRKGMELFIRFFEGRALRGPGHPKRLVVADAAFEPHRIMADDVRGYIPLLRPCIQGLFSPGNSGPTGILPAYEAHGVDFSLYNVTKTNE